MAHKTKVGGTAYDISGGRTLVGGTGYSISKGRTLVGGTGYDISFFPPIGTPLNDLTWEQIRKISDDGLAGSYFSVGDTKTIIINGKVGATTFSNLSIDCFIIGIDHNSGVEGTNKIHFQIGKIGGIDVALVDGSYQKTTTTRGAFTMNTSATGSGGWASSHMRNTVLGSNSTPTSPSADTLLAALPSDLRAVMKAMTKYSDNTGGRNSTAACVTATTDYLPLLAEFEYLGASTVANPYEKNNLKQYDYYKLGNSCAKRKHNNTGAAAIYWSRSFSKSSNTDFCNFTTMGKATTSSANISRGISPLFCV